MDNWLHLTSMHIHFGNLTSAFEFCPKFVTNVYVSVSAAVLAICKYGLKIQLEAFFKREMQKLQFH